jgi:cytochrome c peroxidase
LEHYNTGGQKGFNVNPNVRPLHLSKEDMKDLIAFLNTLTDRSLNPVENGL